MLCITPFKIWKILYISFKYNRLGFYTLHLDFRPINLGNSQSELDYVVSGNESFGTLSCSGKNEIGQQKAPCLFQVLPKGNQKEYLSMILHYFWSKQTTKSFL